GVVYARGGLDEVDRAQVLAVEGLHSSLSSLTNVKLSCGRVQAVEVTELLGASLTAFSLVSGCAGGSLTVGSEFLISPVPVSLSGCMCSPPVLVAQSLLSFLRQLLCADLVFCGLRTSSASLIAGSSSLTVSPSEKL